MSRRSCGFFQWVNYGSGWKALLSPVKSMAEYSLSFDKRW
jgi:hypothetical protein